MGMALALAFFIALLVASAAGEIFWMNSFILAMVASMLAIEVTGSPSHCLASNSMVRITWAPQNQPSFWCPGVLCGSSPSGGRSLSTLAMFWAAVARLELFVEAVLVVDGPRSARAVPLALEVGVVAGCPHWHLDELYCGDLLQYFVYVLLGNTFPIGQGKGDGHTWRELLD